MMNMVFAVEMVSIEIRGLMTVSVRCESLKMLEPGA